MRNHGLDEQLFVVNFRHTLGEPQQELLCWLNTYCPRERHQAFWGWGAVIDNDVLVRIERATRPRRWHHCRTRNSRDRATVEAEAGDIQPTTLLSNDGRMTSTDRVGEGKCLTARSRCIGRRTTRVQGEARCTTASIYRHNLVEANLNRRVGATTVAI